MKCRIEYKLPNRRCRRDSSKNKNNQFLNFISATMVDITDGDHTIVGKIYFYYVDVKGMLKVGYSPKLFIESKDRVRRHSILLSEDGRVQWMGNEREGHSCYYHNLLIFKRIEVYYPYGNNNLKNLMIGDVVRQYCKKHDLISADTRTISRKPKYDRAGRKYGMQYPFPDALWMPEIISQKDQYRKRGFMDFGANDLYVGERTDIIQAIKQSEKTNTTLIR